MGRAGLAGLFHPRGFFSAATTQVARPIPFYIVLGPRVPNGGHRDLIFVFFLFQYIFLLLFSTWRANSTKLSSRLRAIGLDELLVKSIYLIDACVQHKRRTHVHIHQTNAKKTAENTHSPD